jgi:thymidylate kinase
MDPIPYVTAYMDTPINVCVERVKKRRLEKGNEKELDPSNTISHYNATWETYKKFIAAKANVSKINYKYDPVPQVQKLLDQDKELGFVNSYREDKFR